MSRAGLALAGFVALGFVARLAWQVSVGFYEHPEVWEYDVVARNLLTGHGYVYRFLDSDWRTFGTPLYPAVLAVLHALGGGPDSYWLIGVFQAAASAALALPAFAIARRFESDAAGLIAAAVVSAHPGLVVYAAKVHEFTLESLLAASLLVVLFRTWDHRGMRDGMVLGWVAGLAAIARPTLAVVAVVGIAMLAWRRPRAPIVAAAAIVVAAAIPWSVRNALVLGPAAPASPYSCATLWMGNNPNASGTTLSVDGRSVFDAMPEELRARVIGKPEQEQGRVLCDEAMAYLAPDPPRAVAWWARKLGFFWWFTPFSGQLYPASWLPLYRVAYGAELAFVLLGVVSVWRGGWRVGLALVLLELALVSFAQSVAYVEGRHRLLLEPSLAALGGAGGAVILRAASARLAAHSRAPARH